MKFKETIQGGYTFSFANYQRSYEWDKVDMSKLIKSIQQNLYFGVITFKQDNKDDKKLEIVDGQQRLTTIALLFGGTTLNPDKNMFKFNFDGESMNDILNAIINEDTNAVEALKNEINKNSYARYLVLRKNEAKNLMKDFPEDVIRSLWEKLDIDFIDLGEKDVNKSFIAMNSSGRKVENTSILKSRMLEVYNSRTHSTIMKNWNSFVSSFHEYIFNSKKRVSKDEIFRQFLQSEEKEFKLSIDTINVLDTELLLRFSVDFFAKLDAYTKWAIEYAPSTKKPITKQLTFTFVNIYGKLDPKIISWVYSERFDKRLNGEEITQLSFFISIYNTIDFLSNTKDTEREEFIKQLWGKKPIAIQSLCFAKAIELINKDNQKIRERWDERVNDIELRYDRKIDYTNDNNISIDMNLDSITASFSLILIKELKRLIKNPRTAKYGSTLKKLKTMITKTKLQGNTKLTIEHILNKNAPKITHLMFIEKEVNNKLGDSIFEAKFDTLVKQGKKYDSLSILNDYFRTMNNKGGNEKIKKMHINDLKKIFTNAHKIKN